MERDFAWHVKAFCWIAIVLGLTMAISDLYAAGATITAIGLTILLLIDRRPRPVRRALPPGPEHPSEASDTP